MEHSRRCVAELQRLRTAVCALADAHCKGSRAALKGAASGDGSSPVAAPLLAEKTARCMQLLEARLVAKAGSAVASDLAAAFAPGSPGAQPAAPVREPGCRADLGSLDAGAGGAHAASPQPLTRQQIKSQRPRSAKPRRAAW
jgi:hypothetical protein